jgi:excisionase family DNA binding protein
LQNCSGASILRDVPRLMSTVEAAEYLGVSDRRIRQLIALGSLPAQEVGGRHVIAEKDLKLFKARERKPGRPKKGAK